MYIIFIQKKKKKKSTPQSIHKSKKQIMNTPWRDHYAVTIPAPNDQSFIMWALQPNLRQGN
jgi:hypothetical protein